MYNNFNNNSAREGGFMHDAAELTVAFTKKTATKKEIKQNLADFLDMVYEVSNERNQPRPMTKDDIEESHKRWEEQKKRIYPKLAREDQHEADRIEQLTEETQKYAKM